MIVYTATIVVASPIGALGIEALQLWRRRRPYQSFAYCAGLLLIAAGIAHAVIFLIDGGPWAGPVGWRKPTVFGLSLGLTTISLAWFLTYVRVGRSTGWALMGLLGIASVIEYALITTQAWRDVPSHFNGSSALNEFIWIAMGVNIGLVWIATIGITLLAFRSFDGPPSFALAVRAALVLLFIGNLLGGVIVVNDIDVWGQRGAEGSIFGAAGQIKVPHAVGLHALQVLPLIAWFAGFASIDEERRMRIVSGSIAGYSGLVMVNMLQTFGGAAPLDLNIVTGALLLFSIALLLVVAVMVVRYLFGSRARPSI